MVRSIFEHDYENVATVAAVALTSETKDLIKRLEAQPTLDDLGESTWISLFRYEDEDSFYSFGIVKYNLNFAWSSSGMNEIHYNSVKKTVTLVLYGVGDQEFTNVESLEEWLLTKFPDKKITLDWVEIARNRRSGMSVRDALDLAKKLEWYARPL